MLRYLFLVLAGLCLGLGATAIYTFWQKQVIAAQYPPLGIKVDVHGHTIHMTDLRPTGPAKATLLLIHGASGNEADMREALGKQLLEKHYRVISVDRPGQGWSSRPADAAWNTPAGQARLIREALNRHGVTKVITVAHSLAGTIGLQLALDHADFVSGAVLISPVSHPWPGGIAAYYSIAASQPGQIFNNTLALPLGQWFLQSGVRSVFWPEKPVPGYTQLTRLPLVLRPAAFAANAQDVAGLFDFVSQQWPRYKDIRIPTAFVAGDKDTIVGTEIHSRNAVQQIPDASLIVLPGVGHTPHWTRPQAIVAEIEKIYRRVDALPALSSR